MAAAGLQTSWGDLDKMRLVFLMPVGSFTIRAIFYPATLVKTRLMASSAYSGTLDAFRTICRTEGPRALYKGFSVSLLGLFIGPIYMSSLEYSKSKLTEHLPRNSLSQTAIPMMAGACSSVVGQTLSVPVDIVSQRRMMQATEGQKASAVDVAKLLWKEGGLRSFYRGYAVSLITYVPGSSIIWGTVYAVQDPLARVWPRDPALPTDGRWDGVGRDTAICMMSGAIAGTTSAVLLNPLDVLRTRMQVLGDGPPSVIATARALVQERGMRGFASGVSARILTLSPLFSCIIGGYELMKRACAKEN